MIHVMIIQAIISYTSLKTTKLLLLSVRLVVERRLVSDASYNITRLIKLIRVNLLLDTTLMQRYPNTCMKLVGLKGTGW